MSEPDNPSVSHPSIPPLPLTVAADLAPIVRVGVLRITGLTNAGADEALGHALQAAEAAVRRDPPLEMQTVRAMYRRVGLDPTKTRPSSEALLRRVRRGDALPRINTLVDVCNWCSLEFQLPYGLYDFAAIRPPIELRLGRPGEEYPGIRKEVVHVAGRITLADSVGPFGNPTSDSARTQVTLATTDVLCVVFAPRETPERRLEEVLAITSSRTTQYAGGAEQLRAII